MRGLEVELCSPEENMRRDEETLLSFEEDPKGSPLVRLYRWDRLCLSLGHFQREKPNIGLPTVRRPTGGGALLHGWDLSFSLVDSRERWGARPSEIYRRVAGIFIKTFGEIGFEVSLERFRGRYLDSFYCFWVPTLGELSHGGRKVVSLAMRTLRRSFLVHGSVYMDFNYSEAEKLLSIPAEALRKRIVPLKELGIGEEEFISVLKKNLQTGHLLSSRA